MVSRAPRLSIASATVIEYLHKEARVDLSMLQAVVGHEMVDMGVTENYAGDWPVKVLLTDVISRLDWKLI